MKSIGFVILNRNNEIMREFIGQEDELKRVVLVINAAPNTFNMADECPLRVVEAFINDE